MLLRSHHAPLLVRTWYARTSMTSFMLSWMVWLDTAAAARGLLTTWPFSKASYASAIASPGTPCSASDHQQELLISRNPTDSVHTVGTRVDQLCRWLTATASPGMLQDRMPAKLTFCSWTRRASCYAPKPASRICPTAWVILWQWRRW
eukprot:GHRQ01029085.1.p1 GENE.GHRQ01029085.1~~GHRQ01029085.1.p1  ORF type:complete len:148 (-),score=8.28 GHRQ01029085.1:127-570(-)